MKEILYEKEENFVFDKECEEDKTAEGYAVYDAMITGKCNQCRFLDLCKSGKITVFSPDCWCMKRKKEILDDWRKKNG